MQITFNQLGAQLKKPHLKLYIITGDEPLLCQKARDMIKEAADKKGFTQRELVFVDSQFKTAQLEQIQICSQFKYDVKCYFLKWSWIRSASKK